MRDFVFQYCSSRIDDSRQIEYSSKRLSNAASPMLLDQRLRRRSFLLSMAAAKYPDVVKWRMTCRLRLTGLGGSGQIGETSNVSQTSPPSTSEIFVLRLWPEAVGGGRREWRGEIKNLATGEVRYFRRWEEVAELLPTMLGDNPAAAVRSAPRA